MKGSGVLKIKDIKANKVLPFEISDEKLMKLFSFFLHSAPTIESQSAAHIDEQRLFKNWLDFKVQIPSNMMMFFASSYSRDKFINSFKKYGIDDESEVNRRTKAFVCKRKESKKGVSEADCHCLLRHIRNSIAHNNVYIANVGNRKYILFEDYNQKGNISARILLSQTDLTRLKREIMK